MKLAAATPASDQDHSRPFSSGACSPARRAEYSGSSRKTMPVIPKHTASATADPRTMPSSAVRGFTRPDYVIHLSESTIPKPATALFPAKLSNLGLSPKSPARSGTCVMSRIANPVRSIVAPLALTGSCLLLLVATGSSGMSAAHWLVREGAIHPTARKQLLAHEIANILEQNHYSRRPIDKKFSAQAFDHYLNALDGQRSYFTAADIAAMQKWRSAFDDMIHTGQLDPAFLIFARLQQRNRERIEYAISLLSTEPNWKLEETYAFDRDKAPWPRDGADLNDLWRQRVKSDALSLMLTGKTWPEAADTLRKS